MSWTQYTKEEVRIKRNDKGSELMADLLEWNLMEFLSMAGVDHIAECSIELTVDGRTEALNIEELYESPEPDEDGDVMICQEGPFTELIEQITKGNEIIFRREMEAMCFIGEMSDRVTPEGIYGADYWLYLLEKMDSEEIRRKVSIRCMDYDFDESSITRFTYGSEGFHVPEYIEADTGGAEKWYSWEFSAGGSTEHLNERDIRAVNRELEELAGIMETGYDSSDAYTELDIFDTGMEFMTGSIQVLEKDDVRTCTECLQRYHDLTERYGMDFYMDGLFMALDHGVMGTMTFKVIDGKVTPVYAYC